MYHLTLLPYPRNIAIKDKQPIKAQATTKSKENYRN